MNWLEELRKAAIRALEVQARLKRRVDLHLNIEGLGVVVGDPTIALQAHTIRYVELHEHTQDGTLPDVVEAIAHGLAQQMTSAGR